MTKFETPEQIAQKIISSEMETVMFAEALDAETLIKVLSKKKNDYKDVSDHLNQVL